MGFPLRPFLAVIFKGAGISAADEVAGRELGIVALLGRAGQDMDGASEPHSATESERHGAGGSLSPK